MIINLVVEDDLSEAVLRRILRESQHPFEVAGCYGGGGYGYIKKKIRGFNYAARGGPFLVLSDLESECPPRQIQDWLRAHVHPNLLFRIAVREVESWLLADRLGLASFLSVNQKLIPADSDAINNPKEYIINLAKRSRKRALREAIAPVPKSTAKIGPDYNGQLCFFVHNMWNIIEAKKNSESLRRAVAALGRFQPKLPSQIN